jgi:hypothetical protein
MKLARVLACSLLLAAACTGEPKATGTPAPASASPAGGPVGPINYSTKLPGKGAHPLLGRAIRGGSGSTRPQIASTRLTEPATDRQLRKPALADKVDCTDPKMDNASECDGDNLYFCDDNALWVVNCDAETKLSGLPGGSCFEGETFTNCLGCAKADDGTDVCCDFLLAECCTSAGTCYNPKG